MAETGFFPADILLPRNADMGKWSVVACDQYTSQPEYWQEVTAFVGDSPSTLKLTLPEVYLEQEDTQERICTISDTMDQYLNQGVLERYPNSLVYVERTLSDGSVRRGLVGALDLEQYSYEPGAKTLVRATEGTILERIPPRIKVRERAPLELPHVMVLLDDREDQVIGPLEHDKKDFSALYDFGLMKGGGHITGYLVDGGRLHQVKQALDTLADPALQERKYHAQDQGVLLYAVGDGNHSLATAKAWFERVKASMPEEQWKNHPARYALVELVNLHDGALKFEPIHRVVFGVDPIHLKGQMESSLQLVEGCSGQSFSIIWGGERRTVTAKNPTSNLAVGTLQAFLDQYLDQFGGKIDYIHGDDVAANLGAQPGNMAFLLPALDKNLLFQSILLDGALPRKTFSMGHACDKRYYLESRRIII